MTGNKSKFKFYEKSSDNKKPSEGSGEELSNQDKNNKKFKELPEIENWRQILSDFWDKGEPTYIDGHKWRTQHFYQALNLNKIILPLFRIFIRHRRRIRENPHMAKGVGGKKYMKKPVRLS